MSPPDSLSSLPGLVFTPGGIKAPLPWRRGQPDKGRGRQLWCSHQHPRLSRSAPAWQGGGDAAWQPRNTFGQSSAPGIPSTGTAQGSAPAGAGRGRGWAHSGCPPRELPVAPWVQRAGWQCQQRVPAGPSALEQLRASPVAKTKSKKSLRIQTKKAKRVIHFLYKCYISFLYGF